MDQQLVQDQDTGLDRLDDHQITPKLQTEAGRQTTLEQEPTSDPGVPRDQQTAPTPEGNEEALHEHQKHLRYSFPSCDLSEISYHTEQTGFPGSRHSSINTEPLTLDAEQIHDAKDQAVDVMQKVDPKGAFDIFTKETLSTIMGRVSMMEYYWRHGQDLQIKTEDDFAQETETQVLADQINTLVEKAQQVVEANDQQQSKSVKKPPEEPSASTIEDRKGGGNLVGLLDYDEKIKAD